MRRTRRHKIYLVSIFFMIYSIIHVYSDKREKNIESVDPTMTSTTYFTEDFSSSSEFPPSTIMSDIETKTQPSKTMKKGDVVHIDGEKSPETTTSLSLEESVVTSTKRPSHPTWRPKRFNCTPPAIEQFPKPLMGPSARKHGGLILHFLVAIYTFIGLAIVCDEYFVSSLDRICEELKLSPDVAGATFMAAGSSMPELATVVIGVFFAKDDIGVSGVIGSAVFNIMFVISVCALCTNTVSYLNWWPLVRDCFFYALSILVMLFTIYNETITWGESMFMLIMYSGYCCVLHFNPILERWAQTWPIAEKCRHAGATGGPNIPTGPEEQTGLVSYKSLQEERRSSYTSMPPPTTAPPTSGITTSSLPGIDSPLDKAWEDAEKGFSNYNPEPVQQAPVQQVPQQQAAPVPPPVPPPPQQNAPPNYYKPKEHVKSEDEVSPLVRPSDSSIYRLVSWAIVYPIHYMCIVTVPDCKTEKYKNWYPLTFLVSMIWISFYSYFMVWMITIIGSTLGIPDTVMGLTFVAAGVSVPDALSSIAVIKEGYGDMAVSNAVGSNVFDILICLGLPWFIQTAIIKPGSHVNVISKGLTYSTLSLLSTVVFLVVATHLNGWKLDRRYGIILMVWYLVFIVFASMYELNMFGQLNPPECKSLY